MGERKGALIVAQLCRNQNLSNLVDGSEWGSEWERMGANGDTHKNLSLPKNLVGVLVQPFSHRMSTE